MKRLRLLPAAVLLLALCACTVPGNPAPTAAPSPSSSPAPAPTATAEPAPTAAPTPAPTPEPTTEPSQAPTADAVLTVEGKDHPAFRFEEDLAEGEPIRFSCLLPLEEVTAEFVHNAWVLRSAAEPEAFLELSFIAGGDVESLLPGFMDSYLAFSEIEFSEAAALGRVRGDAGRVSASGEGMSAEGWLLDLDGGVLSAALVCPTDAPEEEALLLAVLDSFNAFLLD